MERPGGLQSIGGPRYVRRNGNPWGYVRSDVDGGQQNCSFHPGPEEEDRAAPQGPSLRDTQYVHEAYVTMYIAKERNKGIAQVGILTNALLVQYICWIWFNNQ